MSAPEPSPPTADTGDTLPSALRAAQADFAARAVDEARTGVSSAWKAALVSIAAGMAAEAEK